MRNRPRPQTGTLIRSKAPSSPFTRTRPLVEGHAGMEGLKAERTCGSCPGIPWLPLAVSSGRRSEKFETVAACDLHNPRHVPRRVEAQPLDLDEEPVTTARGQCDQQLPNTGADILEGVGSPLRDQDGVAITQV